MARAHALAAAVLAPFAMAASAGRVTVEMVSEDTARGTVTFAVQNGESRPIAVCLSDQLTSHMHGDKNLEMAPFYWERENGHKWGVVIGTDVALYALGSIDPGQRKEYSVAMPERGRYRAVLDYADNSQLVVDCRALYSGRYSKATSHPVEIPEHQQPDNGRTPQLIPRR